MTGDTIGTVVGDPIAATGDFDGDDGVDGEVAGVLPGAAFVKDDVGVVAGVAEPVTIGFDGPVLNLFVDPRERNAVSILP